MSDFIIPQLGDLAEELVTDFEGVVTVISRHLGGTITVTLEPQFAGEEPRTYPQQRIRVTKPGWAIPSHMATGS